MKVFLFIVFLLTPSLALCANVGFVNEAPFPLTVQFFEAHGPDELETVMESLVAPGQIIDLSDNISSGVYVVAWLLGDEVLQACLFEIEGNVPFIIFTPTGFYIHKDTVITETGPSQYRVEHASGGAI
jgi:hypothetical protein